MNPLRYKTLLTYLPGMASVVNAFDSPQVQTSVYEVLMEALDTKLEIEGLGRSSVEHRASLAASLAHVVAPGSGELTHELVEGDSIHAEQPRKLVKSASTVF